MAKPFPSPGIHLYPLMFYCVLDLFIPCKKVVLRLWHLCSIGFRFYRQILCCGGYKVYTFCYFVTGCFMPSTAAFPAFPATIVTPSPSLFPAFTIVFPKLEATYFIPFPARLATFPTGTKFRSVQPAAMSLSFVDNSFPVIGSLPVTARIASFTQ